MVLARSRATPRSTSADCTPKEVQTSALLRKWAQLPLSDNVELTPLTTEKGYLAKGINVEVCQRPPHVPLLL